MELAVRDMADDSAPTPRREQPGAPEPPPEPVTSLTLLGRARAGDQAALDELLGRYLPRLERWARGRLPGWARDLSDTQDLVQETLIRAFKGMDRFEPRGEGAIGAYLRQAVLNRIRDEIRRVKRQPDRAELEDGPSTVPSPLEEILGSQALDRYERALGRLRDADREAVIAAVEMRYSPDELALVLGKPTANAARVAVIRALKRLAEEMHRDGS
jgi:RNA polymerase sigma factor (sigma-70 family)